MHMYSVIMRRMKVGIGSKNKTKVEAVAQLLKDYPMFDDAEIEGVAVIVESRRWPNADFALGFSGNGITFGVLAADMLARKYSGEEVTDLALFRFGR